MCDRNALIVVGAKVDDPDFPTVGRALDSLNEILCAEPERVSSDQQTILRAVGVA